MATSRVHDIDLLRFLAALSVVFFHFAFRGHAADAMTTLPYPWLAPVAKYGYLGVELFFMISGFVILMTAANGSLRHFTTSRLVRLYPALWVCCTLTFLCTLLIGAPRYHAQVSQYLANLGLMGPWFNEPMMDGVYWSLFVEIHFYVLVALALALGQIHRAQALLVAWLVVARVLQDLPAPALHEWLVVDYASYFIGGATCYLIWAGGPTLGRLAMFAAAWWMSIQQALRSLPEFEHKYQTAMSDLVVVATISCCFLVLLAIAFKLTARISQAHWHVLGAMTYPLYLLHQHMGYMIFNLCYPTEHVHLVFWGTVFGALALAHLIHRYLEAPISACLKRALNASVLPSEPT